MDSSIPAGLSVAAVLMRSDEPLTATELSDITGVSDSTVYRTLRELDSASAIDEQKDGRTSYYTVTEETVDVTKNKRPLGEVYGSHQFEERLREYANQVVFGDEWELSEQHVDLSSVVFCVNENASARHGQAGTLNNRRQDFKWGNHPENVDIYVEVSLNSINISEEFWKNTLRHELIHVMQYQDENLEAGHRSSGDFHTWSEKLDINGRNSDASKHIGLHEAHDYYNYPIYCPNCQKVGGFQRMCKSVRKCSKGNWYCGQCNDFDNNEYEHNLYLIAKDGALLSGSIIRQDNEIKEFVNSTHEKGASDVVTHIHGVNQDGDDEISMG
jgi:SprT-like family./Sugar-specific transcriptional regulator TrmB.